MKSLTGLLLAITVGLLPATALTKEDTPHTKGTGMITVNMETSAGTITLELDNNKAPASVENFVAYVKAGHYDGTLFHRVIPEFMIQGGGFDADMQQKSTTPPVKNEADNGLKNDVGTIAMARTNDPNSATSQFFINLKDNDFLNHSSPSPQGWGYTVFGKVTGGMDVVTTIEKVATGVRNGHRDVPAEDVLITKVTIVE